MPAERTEVLTDTQSVYERIVEMMAGATVGVDILTENLSAPPPGQSEQTQRVTAAYFDVKKRGGRLRILTIIDEKNLAVGKELMKNVELRHLEDVRGNFLMTENEYLTAPGSTAFEPQSFVTVVYSNAKPLIEQNRITYERFWTRAVPAEERIRELEQGVPPPMIEIIRVPSRVRTAYLNLIAQASKEVLIIIPSSSAFRRDEKIGVLDALETAASERGVKVSMICPDAGIKEEVEALARRVEQRTGKRLVVHRRILEATAPNTVTVLVIDRSTSLVIEQRADNESEFEDAIGVATFSTRNSTVLANIRFFERVWDEVELREREEAVLDKERRSRKTAQLLQDIMSHDLRNYNQISKSSAELLKADLQSARTMYLIDTLMRAIDGSSELIDRAKELGRIISQDEVKLHPVDLEASIRSSIRLVMDANPTKALKPSVSVVPGAKVVADELLGEAFTNVLSNAVKYTPGSEVPLEIRVADSEPDASGAQFWKVAITDQGKGIPDDLKQRVFTRYLQTAHGTGLGLSIAYALAVERYSGKIRVSDRVAGDHSKGTTIEIWLPKSK